MVRGAGVRLFATRGVRAGGRAVRQLDAAARPEQAGQLARRCPHGALERPLLFHRPVRAQGEMPLSPRIGDLTQRLALPSPRKLTPGVFVILLFNPTLKNLVFLPNAKCLEPPGELRGRCISGSTEDKSKGFVESP